MGLVNVVVMLLLFTVNSVDYISGWCLGGWLSVACMGLWWG